MSQQLELLLKAKNLSAEAFKAVEGHVRSLEKASKKSETGFAKARKGINDFGKAAGPSLAAVGKAMGIMAGAATAAAAGMVLLAKRGAEVANVRRSFEALSGAIGESGDEILDLTRTATKGLISDMEIMTNANKGLLLGLPITAKEMAVLGETAITLGQAMRIGPEQALNDLVTGLGRGSAMILDNLGITVKAKEANEIYAASIGKAAKDLTDAEKKTALYTAALTAAQAKLLEIGGINLTFAERLQMVVVGLQNFIDALGEAIATSPVLGRALEVIAGTMQQAFGVNQAETVKTLVGHVETFATGLVAIAQVATTIAQTVSRGFFAIKLAFEKLIETIVSGAAMALQKLAGLSESMEALPRILGGTTAEATANIQAQADAMKLWAAEQKLLIEDTVKSFDKVDSAYESAQGFLERLRSEMDKASTAGIKLGHDGAKGITAVGDAAGAAAIKVEKLSKEMVKAVEENYKSAMNRLGTLIEEMHRDADAETKRFFQEYGKGFKRVEEQTINWSDALADVANQFQGLGGIAGDVLGTLAQSIAGIGAQLERLKLSVSEGGLAGAGGIGGFFGKLASGLGIAGGIFGAVTSLFGGLGGLFHDAEEEVNDLRDAFFDLNGGFVAVQESLLGLTDQDLVKKIFDAQTVEQFNAAVAEVNALLGLQGQAQADLQDAIERYGFTIEELGPKWQQQELDKMVGQLLKDYELLVASGIDVNTVIARMGPNLQEYVDTALAAGIALPESMRPIIEAMIEQGALLDANGEAFESIEETGLSFTESLTAGLARVIDSIDKLVAALTGIKPVNVRVNVNYREHNRPSPIDDYSPEFARGGVVLPFRPRAAAGGLVVASSPGGELVKMGEGGKAELAAPVDAILSRMQSVALQASGGLEVVEFKINDEVWARALMRRNRAGLMPIRESSVRRY